MVVLPRSQPWLTRVMRALAAVFIQVHDIAVRAEAGGHFLDVGAVASYASQAYRLGLTANQVEGHGLQAIGFLGQ